MLTKEQQDKALQLRFECGAIPCQIAKKIGATYIETRDFIKSAEKVEKRATLLGFDDTYAVNIHPRTVSYPPRFVHHNELMTLCPI